MEANQNTEQQNMETAAKKPWHRKKWVRGVALLIVAGMIASELMSRLIPSEGVVISDNKQTQELINSDLAEALSHPIELNEAYRILGISASASDAEIKSAWRKKVLEFHPDKVQAKGLPEAFVAFANEQSRKLNQAYETICKARGIK